MFRRAHAAIMAATILMLTPVASAQPALPTTPQGEVVKALLEALNSDDPADIQRIDPRAAGIRLESGGFDVISVEPSGADQIVLVLRDRMFGNYQKTTYTFEPGGTKIIGLRAAPAPGAPPVERLDDAGLAAFVAGAVAKTDYSGTLIVARNGKPVIAIAAGMADREANIANTLETRFRVGSMNKMMTAVGVLQLVQAGKVKLDAPLGTYLKDYPNKELAGAVTIHHLLSHTGGAGDIFGPQFNEKRLELKTLKDYVALYGSRAPEFPPGEDWRYANYGFILLGRVIEEVSGQSYPDYVRDHIFKVASMTRSGFEPEDGCGRRAIERLHDRRQGDGVQCRHAAVARHVCGRRLCDGDGLAGLCECAHRTQAARQGAHRSPDVAQDEHGVCVRVRRPVEPGCSWRWPQRRRTGDEWRAADYW